MATSWKSQTGNGNYALQFETDDIGKYKLVEKATQMAIDGKTTADVEEVVRCKKCTQSKEYPMRIICRRFGRDTIENGYCSYGERRTDNDL